MLPQNRRFRQLATTSTLFAVGVCAIVYGLQYFLLLEPCPLCVLQRLPLFGILLLSVLAILAAPWLSPNLRRIWSLCNCLLAAIGIGLAARHLWLQSLPADQVPSCGPDLDTLFDIMPLAEALLTALAGDGNCAEVKWSLLGLTIPGWALVTFIMLGALWLWQFYRDRG